MLVFLEINKKKSFQIMRVLKFSKIEVFSFFCSGLLATFLSSFGVFGSSRGRTQNELMFGKLVCSTGQNWSRTPINYGVVWGMLVSFFFFGKWNRLFSGFGIIIFEWLLHKTLLGWWTDRWIIFSLLISALVIWKWGFWKISWINWDGKEFWSSSY